ncbi:hypothetical protein JCM19038_2989 [Geomicrobium sp. JCM 19038]|nr:hypothetical protein JCM19038_2989 [Geomicrobium sp. JCM 19038]
MVFEKAFYLWRYKQMSNETNKKAKATKKDWFSVLAEIAVYVGAFIRGFFK